MMDEHPRRDIPRQDNGPDSRQRDHQRNHHPPGPRAERASLAHHRGNHAQHCHPHRRRSRAAHRVRRGGQESRINLRSRSLRPRWSGRGHGCGQTRELGSQWGTIDAQRLLLSASCPPNIRRRPSAANVTQRFRRRSGGCGGESAGQRIAVRRHRTARQRSSPLCPRGRPVAAASARWASSCRELRSRARPARPGGAG